MESKDIKEEPLDPQYSSAQSSRSVFSSFHSENEHFHDEMEKDSAKLFEELDMSRHDNDQMRVKKVKQLVEKYQRIDPKEQITLEKNLEAEATELNKLRQEFQKTQHEFNMKSNQVSIENNSLKKLVTEITEEHKVASEKLNSQSKRFKEVISYLTLQVDSNEQDVLNTVNILANELHVNTDDQSKVRDQVAVVKVLLRKKNKENTTNLEQIANFDDPFDQGKDKNDNDFDSQESENDLQVEHSKCCNEIDNLGNTTAEDIDFRTESNFEHCTDELETISQKKVKGSSMKKRPKPFKCNDCGASFTRKFTLQRHINAVHLKMKFYECDQCQKSYGSKRDLKTHINKIHLKLKSFECDQCKMSFARKVQFATLQCLQQHINGVHLKIRPYECDQCNKSFSRKDSLKRHFIAFQIWKYSMYIRFRRIKYDWRKNDRNSNEKNQK